MIAVKVFITGKEVEEKFNVRSLLFLNACGKIKYKGDDLNFMKLIKQSNFREELNSLLTELRVEELTPVTCTEGQGYAKFFEKLYFKNDDLYMPFSDIPLSGGKVRQAIMLMAENYDFIMNECNSTVYTSTGLSSPQGLIIARVAKEFGFKSVIFVGNTDAKGIRRNPMLVRALIDCKGFCNINIEAKMAFESVLNSVIQKHRELGERFFYVRFGINLEDSPNAILNSVGYQVQNLPNDMEYLIIPCGSCISAASICKGLITYRPDLAGRVKVLGIQISGYDRTDVMERILGEDLSKVDFKLCISRDYDYHRAVKLPDYPNCDNGKPMDVLYEAKAWDYMMRYLMEDLRGKRVLFWKIGNSSDVRFSSVADLLKGVKSV